jgi:hypothetical protein
LRDCQESGVKAELQEELNEPRRDDDSFRKETHGRTEGGLIETQKETVGDPADKGSCGQEGMCIGTT